MKLRKHIDLVHGGRQGDFAASMGVTQQQVSRWVKYGCIWYEGAVYKRQSKPMAEASLNTYIAFNDMAEPVHAKLALVDDRLYMQIPAKDDSKLVVVEVAESIAKDITESTKEGRCNIGLTYDEFLDKYRIYGDVPYNTKDAF